MDAAHAEALAAFRNFNYESIYLRDAARSQANAVIDLLKALVSFYIDQPSLIPVVREGLISAETTVLATNAAVGYVAGMTDRYACKQAVEQLGWPEDRLPRAIDRY
jgi:dGTPase